METYKLYDSEYKFACIVWEHEPVGSGELVRLCAERLGWKKSTTYTVLKKLCERGVLQNSDAVVTALVKREDALRYESRSVVERAFGGSLPQFVAAFLGSEPLSDAEAEELRALIDRHRGVK